MTLRAIQTSRSTGFLDLRDQGLVELPREIASLTRLETLYLSGNRLERLPEWLADLTSLEGLDLQRNGLQMLPERLGQLTNLRRLALDGNELERLPESFGNLASLETLRLNENRLERLPESFGNLANLHTLFLNGNRLERLPESFGNLANLDTLFLNENPLEPGLGAAYRRSADSVRTYVRSEVNGPVRKGVSGAIEAAKSTRVLDLSAQGLVELPAEIAELTNLKTLELDGNRLRRLPAWLGSLTSLETLSLNGNELERLPESIGNLTNLRSLHANRNRLRRLPVSVGNLARLSTLQLNGNPLEAGLQAAYNQGLSWVLAHVRSQAGGSDPDPVREAIEAAKSTGVLDLGSQSLDELPHEIGELTNLRTLFLGMNGLGVLPSWLGRLSNLETLDLNGNGLERLPESFGELANLRALSLDGNPLEPGLQDAYGRGIEAVLAYVRDKTDTEVPSDADTDVRGDSDNDDLPEPESSTLPNAQEPDAPPRGISEVAEPTRYRPTREETADLSRSLEPLLGKAVDSLHNGSWDEAEPGVKAQVEHDIANLQVAIRPLDFSDPRAEALSAASSAVIGHLSLLTVDETPAPLADMIAADAAMTGGPDIEQATKAADGIAEAIELPEDDAPPWYDDETHDALEAHLEGDLPPQEDWPTLRELLLARRSELVASLLGWVGPPIDDHLPSASVSAISTTVGLTSLLMRLIGFPLVDSTVVGVIVASVVVKLRAMFRNRRQTVVEVPRFHGRGGCVIMPRGRLRSRVG